MSEEQQLISHAPVTNDHQSIETRLLRRPYNNDEFEHGVLPPRLHLPYLEKTFTRNPKPSGDLKRELASQTGIPVRTVHNWFRNRRAGAKLESRLLRSRSFISRETRGDATLESEDQVDADSGPAHSLTPIPFNNDPSTSAAFANTEPQPSSIGRPALRSSSASPPQQLGRDFPAFSFKFEPKPISGHGLEYLPPSSTRLESGESFEHGWTSTQRPHNPASEFNMANSQNLNPSMPTTTTTTLWPPLSPSPLPQQLFRNTEPSRADPLQRLYGPWDQTGTERAPQVNLPYSPTPLEFSGHVYEPLSMADFSFSLQEQAWSGPTTFNTFSMAEVDRNATGATNTTTASSSSNGLQGDDLTSPSALWEPVPQLPKLATRSEAISQGRFGVIRDRVKYPPAIAFRDRSGSNKRRKGKEQTHHKRPRKEIQSRSHHLSAATSEPPWNPLVGVWQEEDGEQPRTIEFLHEPEPTWPPSSKDTMSLQPSPIQTDPTYLSYRAVARSGATQILGERIQLLDITSPPTVHPDSMATQVVASMSSTPDLPNFTTETSFSSFLAKDSLGPGEPPENRIHEQVFQLRPPLPLDLPSPGESSPEPGSPQPLVSFQPPRLLPLPSPAQSSPEPDSPQRLLELRPPRWMDLPSLV